MKKYVKPDVYYEDFELSTHIATCAWDMSDSTNGYECIAIPDQELMPGINDVIFNEGNDGCTTRIEIVESYCYTPSDESIKVVFNS